MNVMKRAHELTVRRHNAKLLNGINPAPYKVLFAIALKDAHKENKAMNEPKSLTVDQMFAIKHFEDCIARTLEHFEKLGVNDYYIAVLNNKERDDYTILQHKVKGDVNSPLGWSNYAEAIITHPAQADEYVKAFPGVVKLHAQTYLSRVIESFRDMVANVGK